MKALGLAMGVASALAHAAPAQAEVKRYAVVVGANSGDRSETELRYAESDAQRMATVLTSVGGFDQDNVVVLTDVTAEKLREVIIRMNARVRQQPRDTVLVVYYSGHGDVDKLHLDGTHLAISELRGLLAGSPASARLLIVDSCRSGAITRVKGGRRGPSFDIQMEAPLAARGLAILTSSAAGEDSQESHALGASFFTHHLASALLGAADRDRDGRVMLSEAFAYASARTLAETASTRGGPQHPTFRTDLGGRDDLLLTEPGKEQRKLGILELTAPGSYLIHRGGAGGTIVAEVVSEDGARRIALEAGRYEIVRRGSDHLLRGPVEVVTGETAQVGPDSLQRVDYARVVRKGGTERRRAWSSFATGNARGFLPLIGSGIGAEAGARLDLSLLAVELRVGLATGGFDVAEILPGNPEGKMPTPPRTISAREFSISLAALHSVDVGRFTVGAGVAAGPVWVTTKQRHTDTGAMLGEAQEFSGLLLQPFAQVELPLSRRIYARLDGGAATYVMKTKFSNYPDPVTETTVTYRLGLGLGVYF